VKQVTTREKAAECGHVEFQPAGVCELCDVDWLLATGSRGRQLRADRKEIVNELRQRRP
jgi:hypothetical protein